MDETTLFDTIARLRTADPSLTIKQVHESLIKEGVDVGLTQVKKAFQKVTKHLNDTSRLEADQGTSIESSKPVMLNKEDLTPSKISSLYTQHVELAKKFYTQTLSAADRKAAGITGIEDIILRSHATETALLLFGIKPCVSICPHFPLKDTLTIKLVNAVFKPLYSNFSHLELCKIAADTFEERVGPVNYKNTWLLRDKNHVDYALADQMLKAGVVSTRALGKILGYPVSHDLEMSCDVEYMYGRHQSACALEYQANLHADGARMVDHFIQCETSLKHVGLDIIFTLGGRGFKSDLMARIHALPSVERKRASISGIAYFINTSNREGMDGSLLLGDPALKSCRPFDVLAFMNVLENTSATSDNFVNQLCMAMVNPYVFDLVCVEMAAFDKVLVGKGEKGQLEAWIAQRRPLFPRFFI